MAETGVRLANRLLSEDLRAFLEHDVRVEGQQSHELFARGFDHIRPAQGSLAHEIGFGLAHLRSGKASVVTDHIDRFTGKGILLKSGRELEADIIVTATGFNLNVLGDIAFSIDGQALNFADTITYRGMMFTGVPNMLWVLGYFRGASWTLKADLVADFVCRLLNHMAATGASRVSVALRTEDQDMALLPWIDPDAFSPGHLMRGVQLSFGTPSRTTYFLRALAPRRRPP